MTDDEYTGCGISSLWATDPNDPFHRACKIHDADYTEGSVVQQFYDRKFADKNFLNRMLVAAGDSWQLKLRAYFYYAIARLVGKRYWEGS